MNEDEARTPAPSNPSMLAGSETGMSKAVHDVSYIDRAPDNQVVLSERLEHLLRRVGGCQTEELRALVRRVMYEVISQRKY